MAAHGKTEAQIDREIADMRERDYLMRNAGSRYSDHAHGPWFDAKGEPAAPFADEVPWPERQRADLSRWGLPVPARIVERLLFTQTDKGATLAVDRTENGAARILIPGESTVSNPATLRSLADAFDRIARENGA